jgi:hypothetical protein
MIARQKKALLAITVAIAAHLYAGVAAAAPRPYDFWME